MRKCLIALLTLALLLSALPAMAADSTLTLTLTGGSFAVSAARNMLSMVNEFRTGDDAWYWDSSDTEKIYVTGLGELTYDYELERVAMQRAAELAFAWGHTRPNGERCFTAFPSSVLATSGENIAAGYGAFDTTESAFIAWVEEDEPYDGQGHRRNMLYPYYTTIGIGCYKYDGAYYWVQEFSSVSSGTPSNPVTVPLSVEILKSHISSLDAGSAIRMVSGESIALSDIPLTLTSSEGTFQQAMPCEIDGITWTSSDASIVAISGGSAVAVAPGDATLTGVVDDLSVSLTVKVRGPLAPFVVEISGSMILSSASNLNLFLDIPEVEGADHYEAAIRERESGWVNNRTYSTAGRYGLRIIPDDNVHPIHCYVTVTALDASGDEIGIYQENIVMYPQSGVLRLPEDLAAVGDEAFVGADAYCAIVPDGCAAIGARAFAQCSHLCSVRIPGSVQSIAPDAFDGCDISLVIVAPANSPAAAFAQSKGLDWLEVND